MRTLKPAHPAHSTHSPFAMSVWQTGKNRCILRGATKKKNPSTLAWNRQTNTSTTSRLTTIATAQQQQQQQQSIYSLFLCTSSCIWQILFSCLWHKKHRCCSQPSNLACHIIYRYIDRQALWTFNIRLAAAVVVAVVVSCCSCCGCVVVQLVFSRFWPVMSFGKLYLLLTFWLTNERWCVRVMGKGGRRKAKK